MTRREMLPMPMLLAAGPPLCCETADVPAEAVSFGEGTITVDLARAPQLARAGGAVKLIDSGRKLNLLLTHPGRREYVVLHRACTHGNGPLAYSHNRQTAQCTCWGRSEFALDGKVVGGPAKKPVRKYEVKVEGERLVVQL